MQIEALAFVFSHFLLRCDDDFSGTDCQPISPLSSSLLSDFESLEALRTTWQEVIGGEVVTPDQGCGVVSSGSSLYFSKVCNECSQVIFRLNNCYVKCVNIKSYVKFNLKICF